MKTTLIGILFLNSGFHAFCQTATPSPILIVEQSEIETPAAPVKETEEIQDEGTNDPVSTGATKYEVNGSTIYIKQLPLIRIEQIENKH